MDRSWTTEEGGSPWRPGNVDGSTAWRGTERPAAGWRRSSEVRGACVAAPRWSVRRARPTGVGSALAVLVAVLALGAAAPARAQTTLVSNFDQGSKSEANFEVNVAQRFTTGSNPNKYTLSSVELKSADTEGDVFSVSVCEVDVDGYPTSTCTDLTSPGSFRARTLVFNAPADITLSASTSYALVSTMITGHVQFFASTDYGEDTGGAAGWTVADETESLDPLTNQWVTGIRPLRVAIKGTVNRGTALTDTTLTGLELTTSGGAAVALSDTFSPDRLAYAASVANAVAQVTVTATANNVNATIEYQDGDGAALTDADTTADGLQVDLDVVDENVVRVKVTAEDTTTTETYQVNVDRALPLPGDCEPDDILCATMAIEEPKGDLGAGPEGYCTVRCPAGQHFDYGKLSDTTFQIGSTIYTVLSVRIGTTSSGGPKNLYLEFTPYLAESERDKLQLLIGSNAYSLAEASMLSLTSLEYPSGVDQLVWDLSGGGVRPWPEPTGYATVTVKLVRTPGRDEIPADWSLKPDAVVAGGRFRLLFVSSTVRTPDSTDIVDYNVHVQAAATAGHGDIQPFAGEFTAVASTAAVNVRLNTLTQATDADAPIYWVSTSAARSAVADDYADFYGGTWGDTGARTEAGASTTIQSSEAVATGSLLDGTTSNDPLGGSNSTLQGWYVGGSGPVLSGVSEVDEHRLLGLSPILRVAGGPGAKLAALALTDGAGDEVTLGPAFGPDTTGYAAVVPGERLTVLATPADDAATVAYLDGADATIADLDGTADGLQVDLAPGANVVRVKVTATDGTTRTYEVAVARVQALLVTNENELRTGAGQSPIQAQGFDTGSHPEGYRLTSVSVWLTSVGTSASGDDTHVAIWSDDGGPEHLLAELVSPTFATPGLNAFAAPADDHVFLDPDTTYHVMVNHGLERTVDRVLTSYTSSASETSGHGWTIADTRRWSRVYIPTGWSTSSFPLSMRLEGEERTGTTMNNPPTFDEGLTATREVAENTATGQPFGGPVSAADPDHETLTYELGLASIVLFGIDEATGQLRTRAALDHERQPSYMVAVLVRDSRSGTASIDVTVNVADLDEPPQAPRAPTVSAVEGSLTSLSVRWRAPANTGPPATYDLRYRQPGGSWTDGPKNVAGRTAMIGGLARGTEYEVQVLARNDEGESGWSPAGRRITGQAARSVHMKDVTVHEGETARFTILFSPARSDDRLLWETHDNRARAGEDFPRTSRSIALQAGATEVTGEVEVYADDEAEDEERFQIAITFGDVGDTVEYAGSIYIRDGARSYTKPTDTVHPVPADWSLKPDAVASGGKFRLLFVTTATRDGSSTDIADYNIHVQTAAAAGHADIEAYSGDFGAIGSTTAVNARDNTLTTSSHTDAPIYWLSTTATRGAVADFYADFYDGTWGDTSARTESGGTTTIEFGGDVDNGSVVTGSDLDGTTFPDAELGGFINLGWWLSGHDVNREFTLTSTARRLLALSPIFVVSATELVTNESESQSSAGSTAVTAQEFRTGTNTGGYEVDAVWLKTSAGTAFSAGDTHVRIMANAAGGGPGNEVAALTSPATIGSGFDAFAAPAGTVLDPDTIYHVVMNWGIAGDTARLSAAQTDSNAEQSGLGWTIGDTRQFNSTDDEPTSWTTSQNSLLMRVTGREVTATNSAPVFSDGTSTSRGVDENTAADTAIGTPVTATDADGDTRTYSLEATGDGASFGIDAMTGQLRTSAALDHETKDSYAVTLKADAGNGGTDTIHVTVNVIDVEEQPLRPDAPMVSATANETDSLDVSWTEPGLNGGPAILYYKLQHRIDGSSGSWSEPTSERTGTTAMIGSLAENTRYEVQVRAVTFETPSDWSASGTGRTGGGSNTAPEFDDGTSTTREVAENTASGQPVGGWWRRATRTTTRCATPWREPTPARSASTRAAASCARARRWTMNRSPATPCG